MKHTSGYSYGDHGDSDLMDGLIHWWSQDFNRNLGGGIVKGETELRKYVTRVLPWGVTSCPGSFLSLHHPVFCLV